MTKNTINFQPMPKRFMVWDDRLQRFIHDGNGSSHIFTTLFDLVEFLNTYQIPQEKLTIAQSTNLFDKDGKEIFEGNVVEFRGNKHLVVFKDGCFVIDNPKLGFFDSGWSFGHMDLWHNGMLQVQVIGHILSNPELLEENNV